mgnify:FL=1
MVGLQIQQREKAEGNASPGRLKLRHAAKLLLNTEFIAAADINLMNFLNHTVPFQALPWCIQNTIPFQPNYPSFVYVVPIVLSSHSQQPTAPHLETQEAEPSNQEPSLPLHRDTPVTEDVKTETPTNENAPPMKRILKKH